MVGQHLLYHSPRFLGFTLIAIVTGGRDDGFPQGPAASATPGVAIKRKRLAERLAASAGKRRPCNYQIAGGIADR